MYPRHGGDCNWVPRLGRVRNDEIRKILNLSSGEENIHAYRRRWLDHLLTFNDERDPNLALYYTPDW